jgi:hypothetical protein
LKSFLPFSILVRQSISGGQSKRFQLAYGSLHRALCLLERLGLAFLDCAQQENDDESPGSMTERKPNKADLADWLSRAKAQLANGDVAGALQTLGDILQLAPDHREANNLLRELEYLEKVSSRSGSPTAQPQRNPTESAVGDELSTTVETPGDGGVPTHTLLRPVKDHEQRHPARS